MDKHGVNTDGYIKQLERQLAECNKWGVEFEATSRLMADELAEAREQLAHTTCDHAVALAKAHQRIAWLEQRDRERVAALDSAEARLAAAQTRFAAMRDSIVLVNQELQAKLAALEDAKEKKE